MTGNTEEMAGIIGEAIASRGIAVEIKDILEVDVKDLTEYDCLLLGAYTCGDGDLPDEFLDFYEEMSGINLSGRIAAAFGSCDSSYEHWGRAVDLLTRKLADCGADVVHIGLKMDLYPMESEQEQCYKFGSFIAEKLRGGTCK
jgi:flavodoxin I